MAQNKLVYEKTYLCNTNKWSMDQLKAKANEWGGDGALSHRWHFINYIYNHANNLIKGTVCLYNLMTKSILNTT